MDQRDSQQLARTSSRGELTRSNGEDTEAIRQQIEASRRQIASSLQELRSEVSTTVEHAIDWRRRVRERPQAAVGIAFGIGLYFGLR